MYSYYSSEPTTPPRRVLVTELEHVIPIRNGRLGEPLPPGRHRMRRRWDRLWRDSSLPQVMIVPSQEILTSDGATVRATVSTLVRISHPSVTAVAGDWRSRWHLDVQHALRSVVTQATLEESVADRVGLDEEILSRLEPAASSLGLAIEDVSLRDLVPAGDLKRQMAEVVAARLAGQAALERARGETAALRNLANAASMMKDNPDLFRLRLLQEMSASTGNTFVIDTNPPPE